MPKAALFTLASSRSRRAHWRLSSTPARRLERNANRLNNSASVPGNAPIHKVNSAALIPCPRLNFLELCPLFFREQLAQLNKNQQLVVFVTYALTKLCAFFITDIGRGFNLRLFQIHHCRHARW